MVLLEVIKVFNPLTGTENDPNKKNTDSRTIIAETIQRLTVAEKKIQNS